MKITKTNLQRIIKEELASVLTEVNIAIDEADRDRRAPAEQIEFAVDQLIRHINAYKAHLTEGGKGSAEDLPDKQELNYGLISEIVDGAMNQFIKAVNLAANSYAVNYDYIEYEVGANRLKVSRQAANSLAGEKNAIDRFKDGLRRVYKAPDDSGDNDEPALNDIPDEDAP